jgi:hypothetical protein
MKIVTLLLAPTQKIFQVFICVKKSIVNQSFTIFSYVKKLYSYSLYSANLAITSFILMNYSIGYLLDLAKGKSMNKLNPKSLLKAPIC